MAGILDQVRDVGREKMLQPADTLRPIPRQGKLAGHLIDAIGETLQFIARR